MNTFIKDFSDNLLFDFLNNECNIENDYFILNYNVYKKCYFNNNNTNNTNNNIIKFVNSIKPYYKKQKLNYIERELNYNNFLTIIRHICKYKNIPYRSIIKYDKSKYEIIYYIKKYINS